MPEVHLICGSTGAGKTTFAMQLAGQKGAQRYSIDEWMGGLFWMDAPDPPEFSWAIERVGRCESLIWALALRDAQAGRDVILDLGFSTRSQRDGFKARCEKAGLSAVLWYLDVPADVRRGRVAARNAAQGDTFELLVDDDTFDWMEGYFQAPGPDERATVIPHLG